MECQYDCATKNLEVSEVGRDGRDGPMCRPCRGDYIRDIRAEHGDDGQSMPYWAA